MGPRQPERMRLLVVVDGTDASTRVLRYIGPFAIGCRGVEIQLAYLEARLPPALLESGGAELPEREQQIEADLRAEQQEWIKAADRAAGRILRTARTELERAGVDGSRIATCTSSPLDAVSAAENVLLLARDQECHTIVVGHRAHGWVSGVGGGHLAEQLVRKANGDTVWVVD